MNTNVSRMLFATTVLAGLGPLSASSSFAQTAPAAGSVQSDPEEIVVTARSREEKLKDVPISITAISGATLQKLDLTDVTAIANFSPSLNFLDFATGYFSGRLNNRPLIFRGLNLSNNFGINAASLVFLDGSPLLGTEVPVGMDIARVEVLRGPQSVYFGRSTMTGALNYVTKTASNYWQGDFEAKVATYDTKDIKANVSGPIVEDSLNVGIGGELKSNGGYDNNPGNPGEKLGAEETDSITGTFDWRPIEGLSIKGFGNYFTNDDGPGDAVRLHPGSDNCNLGGTVNYYCGTLPGYQSVPNAFYANTQVSPLEAANLWKGYSWLPPGEFQPKFGEQRHAILGNINVSYDLGDFAVIESRTSYEHDLSIGANDSVLQPTALARPPGDAVYGFSYGDNTADFNQELRIRSAGDGPLNWTAGGNFVRAVDKSGADLVLGTATPLVGGAFAPGSTELGFAPTAANSTFSTFPFPFGNTYSRTYGLYAGLTYDFTDQLQLSAEGRYQWDERKATSGTTVEQAVFKSFSPRVALNYKITPDITAYASYAKGSRPGGFNTALITPPENRPDVVAYAQSILGPVSAAYKEEDLKTWEGGVKGDAFDHRVHFDVDGYYGILENEQVTNFTFIPMLGNTFTATNNIGLSHIWGVEAEGGIKVTDQLSFDATFAWNHTEIVNYLCTSCVQYTGSALSPIGRPLGSAPEYSGSIQADYRDKLLQTDWDWYAHVDYVYRGMIYITNYASTNIPSRNVVNLRAGVDNGSFTIEGFVENVTNDRNYESANEQTDFSTSTQSAFDAQLPPPRTFGARVHYHFAANNEAAPAPTAYVPPPVVAPAPAPVAHSYQVFFDFNKSDLTPEAVKVVDQAAANAAPAKVTRIDVTGHTDTVGSDAYNMRLSRRRAESVAAELQARGIPSSEIAIFAKGKHDLLVPTGDGVREPQNRRVQIVYEGGPSA
jgi:iron complex outermembrane receptor protein